MTNAKRDENYVPTLLATDGGTGQTFPVGVDPLTGALLVRSSGYSVAPDTHTKDENRVPVALGVSGDEVVPILGDPITNRLNIQFI